MIVDTSAIIAILKREQGWQRLSDALTTATGTISMSAANYVECGAVVDRIGDPVLSRRLDELLDLLGVEVEPVTVTQAAIARTAFRDFGKGSGHPAGLNFGDCFSYALAIERGRPLLCVGDDFHHTDVHLVGESE